MHLSKKCVFNVWEKLIFLNHLKSYFITEKTQYIKLKTVLKRKQYEASAHYKYIK